MAALNITSVASSPCLISPNQKSASELMAMATARPSLYWQLSQINAGSICSCACLQRDRPPHSLLLLLDPCVGLCICLRGEVSKVVAGAVAVVLTAQLARLTPPYCGTCSSCAIKKRTAGRARPRACSIDLPTCHTCCVV